MSHASLGFHREFEPAYLRACRTGALQERAARALEALQNCQTCPRLCGSNRLAGDTGTCQVGRFARVSSFFPHFGEEDCLRGWRGSGTIFFAQCNLRCIFCQNFDISQQGMFPETPPARLAEIMLELQRLGCHNINLVTPTHVVPQILEALPLAIEAGLRLPLVYNTSGYDSLQSLRLLDGIVDIYMPDFKIWDPKHALRYLRAKDYPGVARRALIEMHSQVGNLRLDQDGIAQRGLLVRHLVLPEQAAGTGAVARFLARRLSPDTALNLMDQYRPARKALGNAYPPLARRITAAEYATALQAARREGLHRFL